MGEFLLGWRRKVGVLTFGFAVLAMLAWVRSLTTHDEIEIAFESRVQSIASQAGTIDWQIKQWHNDFLPNETIEWTTTTNDPRILRVLWLRTIRSDMILNGKKLPGLGTVLAFPIGCVSSH